MPASPVHSFCDIHYFPTMKIVVLDGYTVNPGDLSWQPIQKMGDVTIYDRTAPDEIVSRSKDAEVVIVNKVRISGKEMDGIPNLGAICLLATGYDNVDVDAARERNIQVYNAVGYGSESVAQHALSMMLNITNRIELHHQSVQRGDWGAQDDFSYSLHTVTELKGKTLGLLGYGKIGERVGELARAFGMKTIAYTRSGVDDKNVENVIQKELFVQSDFLTLHAPLNDDSKEIINRDSLALMKETAYLINTGRGGLVNEADLIRAVTEGGIAGAALDVVSVEPPKDKNPIMHVKNIWVTPHMAWRSFEARSALIRIVAENIQYFKEGKDTTNQVV